MSSKVRGENSKKSELVRTAQDDVVRAIILVHNAYLSNFERHTQINVARWRLLSVMYLVGTCSQSDLTARTTIGPAAVTRILKDFEREGLVKRIASKADARQMLCTLTDQGRKLVSTVAVRREKLLSACFKGFSASDVETLKGLLGRIGRNLGAPLE